MELVALHGLLIDAINAVDSDKRFTSMHKLNRIINLLEPMRNDYSDVMIVHRNLIKLSKSYWLKTYDKDIAFAILDDALELCESWIECRSIRAWKIRSF